MNSTNPFDILFNKLDKIEQSQIIIANRLMEKVAAERKAQDKQSTFLTLPDVAKILQKPVGTVRSYIHSRGLPAKRMGKSYLIHREELDKWLTQWMQQEENLKASSENESDEDGYKRMLQIRKRYQKK